MTRRISAMVPVIMLGGTTAVAGELPARPVPTYSIVALDSRTGQLGVAVQSHWFSVGTVVPWARAGVGAVATQSFAKIDYGPDGLDLMADGMTAEETLVRLIDQDPGQDVRQVAMVDAHGNVAVHTGSRCVEAAGHQMGNGYSVQANLMANSAVWPAMAQAFESTQGDLADRMLAALEAAEKQGGDIRGRQSAAMLIVTGEPTGVPWKDVILDLRVEDDPSPLKQLRRLIRIHRAYEHANRGDLLLEKDDVKGALQEYRQAAEFYPENPELPFWTAVTLADGGKLEEALPIFKKVFAADDRWRELVPRLVKSKLLPDNPDVIEDIISQ